MSTTDRPSRPPGAWTPIHRAAEILAAPILRILAVEAASGVVLLGITVVALVWANVWATSYHGLWHLPLGVQLGNWSFVRPLHFWINDGLMTVFFLVVGLEIRREIFEGELKSFRKAALPIAAALGGMLVPAMIFIALNVGRGGAAGWAIPMATDIAFAVGVLTLLGSRIPVSLRVMLLALAVIDDLGAIVVISAFYSSGVAVEGLAIIAVGLAAILMLRFAGVRAALVYVIPGGVIWAGLLVTGIHPTIAGVLLGLLTPVRSWLGSSRFVEATHAHLDQLPHDDHAARMARLDLIKHDRRETVSPVDRLIHVLHPWVAFGVMPLFALANAGVSIGGADLAGDSLWLFIGIVAGLAVGKPLGIVAAALGASRVGIAHRTDETTRRGVLLVGIVAGIGFTMSLFIAQLAFPPGPLLDAAKLAILVGSGVAMVVGVIFGLATTSASEKGVS